MSSVLPEKSPRALKETLTELETAIRAWDHLESEETPQKDPVTEMKNKAQDLLKRLREQIDEFSD